jgi:hypothetical protein
MQLLLENVLVRILRKKSLFLRKVGKNTKIFIKLIKLDNEG